MPHWSVRPDSVIVDDETFSHLAELQTRQAGRLQYAVSALTLYVEGDTSGSAAQLAAVMSGAIRSSDVIGIVAGAGITRILLVGGDLDDLGSIIQRIVTEMRAHGFADLTAVLSIGGASFPATATSAQELLRQADALADEVRQDPTSARYRLRGRGGPSPHRAGSEGDEGDRVAN
jgi:hypothetical protein